MKKLSILLLSLLAAIFLWSSAVGAQGINDNFCSGEGASTSLCSEWNGSGTGSNPIVGPDGILTKVTMFFALITGVVSVIIIILMGLRYVTSNGDAGKAASARQGIIYAIAGLIVALLAQSIVMLVLSKM